MTAALAVDLFGQPLPAPAAPRVRRPLAPPPPRITGGYGLLLIDLPWEFQLRSAAGEEKSAQAHYDCWSTEELATVWKAHLGIDWLTAPDCVAVFWATFPQLPDAFEVMHAWGFKYSTGGCWFKRTSRGKAAFGTGFRLRGAAEPFLVATRGAPPLKARNVRNVIEAATRGHSRKPDAIYALCEAIADGPYLEICARQAPPGWDVWGNEVGRFAWEGG